MQPIVAVCGPTASGKSALALSLCRAFGGEIVSFDSMQIYRGMNIGTSKPTAEEQKEIPHHLIDICEPSEPFSVADFSAAAEAAVSDILSRGKVAVLCGGTGLYLDSFISRRDYGDVSSSDELRDALSRFAKENGAGALHKMLEELDEEAAAAIHENNVKRVIRAIEICKLTGMTKTEWDKKANSAPSRNIPVITMDFRNRNVLYNRINKRVDAMISAGLADEAARLYAGGFLSDGTTASQAIGYKEMLPYVKGEASLDEAAESLKLATRRYAKRQITWFKKYDGIRLYVDDYASQDELAAAAIKALGEV